MSPALALGQRSSHFILYHAHEECVLHGTFSHSKDSEAVVVTFVVGPGDAEAVGFSIF